MGNSEVGSRKKLPPMTEYFCNGYYCDGCGTLVGVMKREISTMCEVTNSSGQVGIVMGCPKCGKNRALTYEEMLALPEKWILQE
jgi:hypothetical protein